jgi:benzoyl-CoA reductase/2-hydroxyglutaryl-CoA dehydratase subunit BcrC/BadD/HgdB
VALSAGCCAFAEAVVKFAEARGDAVVVFPTTCDQLRRGYDAVGAAARSRTFLFNVPATWQTPAAKALYRSELQRLGKFLAEWGGQAPTPESLRRWMQEYSRARQHLLEAAPARSARDFAEAVARFHWEGPCALPQPAAGEEGGNQVSLALVGGPFLRSHWQLLEVIERAGGRVVLNGTEAGERSLGPVFVAGSSDPFEALVNGWFEGMADAFQRPNTPLYDWLRPRLAARSVKGIVLWHFTSCDLWRAEAQSLREACGMPVLLLETDEQPGISPRELNRVQAFVETLK